MNDNSTSGGIGFSSLLQLTFIILKLCKVISWSWWWVLSPTWIGISLVILILLAIGGIAWWGSTRQVKIRRQRSQVIDKIHGEIDDFRTSQSEFKSKWERRLNEMKKSQSKSK